MIIGNTCIDGWTSKPRLSLGLNLEFSRSRPTWICLPFGTICIRKHISKRPTKEYTSDVTVERGKLGKFRIIEHIEPWGNKKFFNLGFSNGILFIGRYQIIW